MSKYFLYSYFVIETFHRSIGLQRALILSFIFHQLKSVDQDLALEITAKESEARALQTRPDEQFDWLEAGQPSSLIC